MQCRVMQVQSGQERPGQVRRRGLISSGMRCSCGVNTLGKTLFRVEVQPRGEVKETGLVTVTPLPGYTF